MIAIYSNSNPKIYGGVEILVFRFAKFLKDKGIEFLVIEPEGTLLHSQLERENLISPGEIERVASKVEMIFFPNISKVRQIDTRFQSLAHAKFLGWIVHPNEPFRSFMPYSGKFLDYVGYKGVPILSRIFSSNFSAAADFFNFATLNHSVLSMDAACSRALKFFYPIINQSPRLLPIPCEISDPIDQVYIDSDSISIAYFGRLDEFKASALLPIISNQLSSLAQKSNVVLHIFGDGPCLNYVVERCRSNRIVDKVHGYLPNQLARHQIRENTHFAIAMGTSALDVAVTGHPCFFIDPALSRYSEPQKKFRLVHQTDCFTLGEYRDFPGYVGGVSDFCDCLDNVYNGDCGQAGRNYVQKWHSAEFIFEKLIGYLQETQATLADFMPFIAEINEKFVRAKRFI